MDSHRLSTGGGVPSPESKKREAEKKPSPLKPYKEKEKRKEHKPGANSTCLNARGARTRTRMSRELLRRHVSRAVEDALVAFCGTRGPAPSDEALWARFAWRFGFWTLHHLTEQAKSEMKLHRGGVEPSERPRILQNLLNEVWYARYPKSKGQPAAVDKAANEGGAA